MIEKNCGVESLASMFMLLFNNITPVCWIECQQISNKKKARCLKALIGMLYMSGYGKELNLFCRMIVKINEK